MDDDDSFVFNEGFAAPLYRIKVVCFLAIYSHNSMLFDLHKHG